MSRSISRGISAGLVAVLLAACTSSSTSTSTPVIPAGPTGNAILTRIIGVGDSLTAGVQSDSLLGVTISPNPLGAGSPFPFVPNTQGHGYWARIWSQANGGADPLNVAISPLPLIAPPGDGQILLPSSTGSLTSIVASACASQASVATSYATALQSRLNPTTKPLDLGVPGITLREAIVMTGPVAPCGGTGLPASLVPLVGIVNSEDTSFWPVLGNFPQGATQLQDAVSLQPTLSIVWLGSNDLLHFAFSNGVFPQTDPVQFQNDTINVIQTLQRAGSRVVISNLVDVLNAATFTKVGTLPAVFTVQLGAKGVPPATAQALAAQVQAYLLQNYGLGNGAYLILGGAGKVQAAVSAVLTGAAPSINVALSAPAAHLVAGDFVSDATAATTQSLNTAYNAAIGNAATQTGATLVDTHAFTAAIFTAGGLALPGNPKCCSTFYGGGFFSLDGLHPSDTAYALLANNFIATIDTSLGVSIPQLTTAQITAINATDLYSPH